MGLFWGLAGPLQQVDVIVPKPLLDDLGDVCGVVVLQEDKSPVWQAKLPH